MADPNTILSAVTLAFVTLVGALAKLGQSAIEAGVKKSAEEGAAMAVKNLNWPVELAHELEKVRGTERQEARLQSYGALWAELRPLAIYDRTVLDPGTVVELSTKLTEWYFKPKGGLLLTPQVREFYFALQDVLQTVGTMSGWKAERHAGDLKASFEGILESRALDETWKMLDDLDHADAEKWFAEGATWARVWRRDVGAISQRWAEFDPKQRFTILQQVGSVLRTSLTKDMESRIR